MDPPKTGLYQRWRLAPVFVIVIFVGLVLSILIPVPPVSVFPSISVPVAFPIKIPLSNSCWVYHLML